MSKICCTKALGVLFFIFCSLIINGQEQLVPSDTLRNVRLREVVVTATQPDAPGTSSLIGQDAIRHIQATDLSDLSQLLPGVLTRNPDLNSPAVFTIRSATYENTTNALGIKSSRGRGGGTIAHPEIAEAFRAWLFPEYMLRLVRWYRMYQHESDRIAGEAIE